MVGVAWDSVTHAGAFLIGAVLATIACLRVVRAVIVLFEGTERRLRDRRIHERTPEGTDGADDP